MKPVLRRLYLTLWTLAGLWGLGMSVLALSESPPKKMTEHVGSVLIRNSDGTIQEVASDDAPIALAKGWQPVTAKETEAEYAQALEGYTSSRNWMLGLAFLPLLALAIVHAWVKWLASPDLPRPSQ